jgi:ubiquinone biosynthesis protein COQ9
MASAIPSRAAAAAVAAEEEEEEEEEEEALGFSSSSSSLVLSSPLECLRDMSVVIRAFREGKCKALCAKKRESILLLLKKRVQKHQVTFARVDEREAKKKHTTGSALFSLSLSRI